jgi:hypothetical protein
MQTTVKHDAGDLVVYVGVGETRALLLYPAWLFEKHGGKGAPAFGRFPVARGWALHLGLFGVHWLHKGDAAGQRKPRAKAPEPEPLPGFVEPTHPPQTTTALG